MATKALTNRFTYWSGGNTHTFNGDRKIICPIGKDETTQLQFHLRLARVMNKKHTFVTDSHGVIVSN